MPSKSSAPVRGVSPPGAPPTSPSTVTIIVRDPGGGIHTPSTQEDTHATDATDETSTDYTYQIPSEFNPSRDGTFLTGEKNAINFSRSYDAASNS